MTMSVYGMSLKQYKNQMTRQDNVARSKHDFANLWIKGRSISNVKEREPCATTSEHYSHSC